MPLTQEHPILLELRQNAIALDADALAEYANTPDRTSGHHTQRLLEAYRFSAIALEELRLNDSDATRINVFADLKDELKEAYLNQWVDDTIRIGTERQMASKGIRYFSL